MKTDRFSIRCHGEMVWHKWPHFRVPFYALQIRFGVTRGEVLYEWVGVSLLGVN